MKGKEASESPWVGWVEGRSLGWAPLLDSPTHTPPPFSKERLSRTGMPRVSKVVLCCKNGFCHRWPLCARAARWRWLMSKNPRHDKKQTRQSPRNHEEEVTQGRHRKRRVC